MLGDMIVPTRAISADDEAILRHLEKQGMLIVREDRMIYSCVDSHETDGDAELIASLDGGRGWTWRGV